MHLKKIIKHWQEYFLLVVISGVFFYDVARQYLSAYVKYFDEFIVVVLLLLSIGLYVKGRRLVLYKEEKVIALCGLSVITIGLISSVVYGYQCPKGIFYDFVVFSKFLLAYFVCRYVFSNNDLRKFYDGFAILLIYVFIGLMLALVLDSLADIFPNADERFGIPSVQLFFSHPSRFAFSITLIFVILFPYLRNKGNNYALLVILIAGLLSLRYKYLGFFIVSLLVVIFNIDTSKIIFRRIVPVAIVGATILLLITQEQIRYYYSKDAYEKGFTRSVLSVTSYSIAKDHIPLGSGFGTFGSYYSGVFYSDIYYKYNISDVEGINEFDISYITDTYWPMVLGQFGFVGFGLMLSIIFLFFKLLIRLFNQQYDIETKRFYMSSIMLLIAICVDSTSDAVFSQIRGVVSFIFISMIVNISCKDAEKLNTTEV